MLIKQSKLHEPVSQIHNWPKTVLEKLLTPSESEYLAIQLLLNDLKSSIHVEEIAIRRKSKVRLIKSTIAL